MKTVNLIAVLCLAFNPALPLTPLMAGNHKKGPECFNHDSLQATLWMQTSAEYHAVTTGIYNSAREKLILALQDPDWTASLEQSGDYQDLPPAVILDVDETVLDNSPYAARNIRNKQRYSPQTWTKWCKEAQAESVPGALEFTQFAARNGITVFYITNRDSSLDESTRQNLANRGFPLDPNRDTVLTNGEKPNWGSSKVERRQHVAKNYRILLLFGDDFNDFTYVRESSAEERNQLVEEAVGRWGIRWFLLPNPTYGSWERALRISAHRDDPKKYYEAKLQKLNPAQ